MGVIQGTWVRDTDAATEPITVSELGTDHLKLDAKTLGEVTTYLESRIKGARQSAEEFTRRAFITQTWILYLDEWPEDDVILLPRPPAATVTHVKYYDTDGTQQSLTSGTDYQTELKSEPARITVEPGESWPALESGRLNPIEVKYTCGYGAASAVPVPIKDALLLMCASRYEYREDMTDFPKHELPVGARRLLWQYRMPEA